MTSANSVSVADWMTLKVLARVVAQQAAASQ